MRMRNVNDEFGYTLSIYIRIFSEREREREREREGGGGAGLGGGIPQFSKLGVGVFFI
jgi:hypothetical protein